MNFEEFELRAHEMFATIPPQYLDGVDGLLVESHTQPHPSLPEIFTLGECRTEHYPSEYGGPGAVRSLIVLYYGSFLRLSELDEDWDWEEELWETITHEVRHHLESLAAEDALEIEDYVVDQNFARREGEEFDPFFYREGRLLREGVYQIDHDVFIERELSAEDQEVGTVRLEWRAGEAVVPLPEQLGGVHFLTLEGLPRGDGDVILVLRRRTGVWAAVRSTLAGEGPPVRQSSVKVKLV